MKADNGWRFSFMMYAFFGLALILVGQLVRLQFSPQQEAFRIQAERYERTLVNFEAPRGQIYDRYGNLLAGNLTVFEVGVTLADVKDPDAIAFALNGLVGLDYNEVFAIVSQTATETAVYAQLAEFVPAEAVSLLKNYMEAHEDALEAGEEVATRNLSGLEFHPHLQRSYPESDLAANILGFVNREGLGFYGIESFYNEQLAGVPQQFWVPVDPNQVEEMPDIPPGMSLILTIDRNIQAEMENILDAAVEETKSIGGTIVVMDPKTGELLAMASNPRLNLNEYWNYPEVFPGNAPFNPAVGNAYEPGSVFKVLTMAAALDSGTVDIDTPFFDSGAIEVGGIRIRNWDGAAWGPQNMLGCMQNSLNVCLAWLGTEMGAGVFYDYMNRFGFGHSTGIDLANEADGRLKTPGDGDWYPADLGTNSFGQGISVTPIQMLMAISAVANEGKMVLPHIVRARVDGGSQYPVSPLTVGTPITAQTARELTEMLAKSLENEASTALVFGYRVAGKTGTAEIPSPEGYTRAITNVSFVGWGPVDDPKFLVYIWLEEPGTSIWGSIVAAPVFRDVVERLVVLMDLPPDAIRAGN